MSEKLELILVVIAQLTISATCLLGGSPAEPGQFPFSVSLQIDNVHYCGASIINEQYLLSAAGCISFTTPVEFVAYIGSVYLDHGGSYHNVSSSVIHPDYDPNTLSNDIGIIKLTDPIQFGDNVQPIRLPVNVTLHRGDDVTIIGWGYTTGPDGETPNQLQYLNFDYAKTSSQEEKIHMGANARQALCYGDGGSPLVYQFNNESYVVGLPSPWIPCETFFPDVYTDASEYIDWIQQNINQ